MNPVHVFSVTDLDLPAVDVVKDLLMVDVGALTLLILNVTIISNNSSTGGFARKVCFKPKLFSSRFGALVRKKKDGAAGKIISEMFLLVEIVDEDLIAIFNLDRSLLDVDLNENVAEA